MLPMKVPLLSSFDHHMHEVLRGASVALVLKTLAAVLTFAFNVVLARLLGADGAGMYFLALTVSAVAEVLGSMGLESTLLRFTAASATVGDWGAVKGVYTKGLKLAVGASSSVTIAIVLTAPWLAEALFSKPALTALIGWMALAAMPVNLFTLYAQLLKGLKRIPDAIAVESVYAPALSLLGAMVLVPLWGVRGAVWAYLLAAGITLAIAMWLWRRATPQLRGLSGKFDTSLLLSSSMPLFWVSILVLVTRWSSTIILGIWGTSAAVGIFGVAHRTAALTNFVLIAVNSIAAPKFAALYQQRDMEALEKIAQSSAMLMTLIALPVLIIFLLVPAWIMKIFGPHFSDYAIVLPILAVGQFVNVATGSVQFILMMCGYERLMRDTTVLCAVLTVVFTLALVPLWGVIGAAVAATLVRIFQNVLITSLVRQRLGIWTLPTFRGGLVAK
jgi:O-antigen/teichoic acid export membrane protein